MHDEINTTLYCDCLYEISQRIKVIANYLNQNYRENVYRDTYRITVVEFLSLQFRKIIEIISYLSFISNKEIIGDLIDIYKKYYDIREIFSKIKDLNPEFFPMPVSRELIDADKKLYKWNPKDCPYLTAEKAIAIYESCGKKLHAINPFSPDFDYLSMNNEFHGWLTEIHVLMAHHIVTIQGGESIISAIMETVETGYPQVVIMTAQEKE